MQKKAKEKRRAKRVRAAVPPEPAPCKVKIDLAARPELEEEQKGDDAERLAQESLAQWGSHAASVISTDPANHAEAMNSEHAAEWLAAEQAEHESLVKFGVFQRVDFLPAGCKALGARFVYKGKL